MNLNESQGSLKYSGEQLNSSGLSFGFEDDEAEEEEEEEEDYPKKNNKNIMMTSVENDENNEDYIKMDDSMLFPTDHPGTSSSSPLESSDPSPAENEIDIVDESDRDVEVDIDVDEVIERSEGIIDDVDDHDSFGLGDAFISFSNAPPSTSNTSSNKRSYDEEEEEEVGEVVRMESKIVKTETISKAAPPSATKFIKAKKLKKLKSNKNSVKSYRNK